MDLKMKKGRRWSKKCNYFMYIKSKALILCLKVNKIIIIHPYCKIIIKNFYNKITFYCIQYIITGNKQYNGKCYAYSIVPLYLINLKLRWLLKYFKYIRPKREGKLQALKLPHLSTPNSKCIIFSHCCTYERSLLYKC
jgi:hypothetical protein